MVRQPTDAPTMNSGPLGEGVRVITLSEFGNRADAVRRPYRRANLVGYALTALTTYCLKT
jgi:hypothetical protein